VRPRTVEVRGRLRFRAWIPGPAPGPAFL